jgi:hypothetical protein
MGAGQRTDTHFGVVRTLAFIRGLVPLFIPSILLLEIIRCAVSFALIYEKMAQLDRIRHCRFAEGPHGHRGGRRGP